MSPEQKEMVLAKVGTAKEKVVTLWKSGKKGKAIIIVGALFIIGLVGQCFDEGSVESGTQTSTSAEGGFDLGKQDELQVDKSLLKNASEDTAKANNEVVPVIRGTSILTIARDTDKWSKEYKELKHKYNGHGAHSKDGELGYPVTQRRFVEKLYSEGFYSPVTLESAKIDTSKPRFSLFGGTLKIGDEIQLPANVCNADKDERVWNFYAEYAGKKVQFNYDSAISGDNPDKNCIYLIDNSQVWSMEYDIKEFMGLDHAVTKWYRAPGSSKLVMFWCEVKNRRAGNSADARETRGKFEKAIQGKYQDMKKTYHNKISDEYMLNGDVLEIMQSPVSEEGGFFDAPYVKVSMITPSIVVKLLGVIDEMIKRDFELFKKKEQGVLDNF